MLITTKGARGTDQRMRMTHGENANRLTGWTEIGLDGVGGHQKHKRSKSTGGGPSPQGEWILI